MARGEKDQGTNWLTQHHAPAVLRMLGVADFRPCRPAHARITLPQQIPDGLLEVRLPDSKDPVPVLLEWEAYPSKETEKQVIADMDLAEMALDVLPDTVVIVLCRKGAEQSRQRTQSSVLGWSQRRHRWRVVPMWTIADSELLALNEVGLVPLLPLTRSKQKAETLLQQCKERIEQQASANQRVALLTITAILATMRFARAEEWLAMLGGKNVFSHSPLYQQWMHEKASETKQSAIVSFLHARFKKVPEELAAEVRTLSDLDKLERCIEHAAVCKDLDDFRKRFARL